MEPQRRVIIISENAYYRAVFRETLSEAGFLVNDTITAENLSDYLETIRDAALLLIEQDLDAGSADELLAQVNSEGATAPGMSSVCLLNRPVRPGELESLKTVGFAGSIQLSATPEQIIFRINDLIFSEAVKQRKNLRAPVSIPAELVIDGQRAEGLVASLSKQGLFIKTNRAFPVNSAIDLKFTLPPSQGTGPQPVEVSGRVNLVKGRTGPEDITFGPGMVVIFDILEAGLKMILDEFVAGELEQLSH